jgi:hypothetical protein
MLVNLAELTIDPELSQTFQIISRAFTVGDNRKVTFADDVAALNGTEATSNNTTQIASNSPSYVATQAAESSAFAPSQENLTTYSTAVTATGIVVPANSAMVQLLPQGIHIDNVLRIFTTAPVSNGNESSGVADIILFKGRRFLVYSVNHWEDFGFAEVLAVFNDSV